MTARREGERTMGKKDYNSGTLPSKKAEMLETCCEAKNTMFRWRREEGSGGGKKEGRGGGGGGERGKREGEGRCRFKCKAEDEVGKVLQT